VNLSVFICTFAMPLPIFLLFLLHHEDKQKISHGKILRNNNLPR